MDKPISGKPLALVVLAFALVGVANRARAQESPDKKPGGDPAAPAPGEPPPAPLESPPTSPGQPQTAPASRPGEPPPAPLQSPPTSPGQPQTAPASRSGEPPPRPSTAGTGAREAAASWFDRPPLAFSVGEGAKKWTVTLSGFVEVDYIVDSTRSYDDAINGTLVARSDTYNGRVGRSQFSARNTRLGFTFESPIIWGVKPSAVIEADFFGNQLRPPTTSEAAFFANPGFRLRNAYLKLQNDYVDVVAGQTYDVFGWQNYFSPCTVEFLGLPNQLFSRSLQFRLSHTFNASGAFSVDAAASAVRPAQRDSMVPDVNAGLRFSFNRWKGIATPGNVGTVALPVSIGVSATVRQFKVNAFTPPPTQSSNAATGWGLSVDALIPVIPAANANDRANRLTLTGSFVTGTGIGDLINADGGAQFPTLPNPAQANPPPLYSPNIDNGLVSFDTLGVLHTIDWQAFRVGLQYYFPTGRVTVSANYTQGHSKNMAKLFPKGGAEIELLGRVADTSRYADVNLFFDATPAVRFGLSGHYTMVEYLDGDKPHNYRGMAQALYAF